jgi:hypothetical protein
MPCKPAMVSRAKLVQYVAVGIFVVGAILLGVGSAGIATPLIIGGVILIVVSGGMGFIATMESQTPSHITYRNPVVRAETARAV